MVVTAIGDDTGSTATQPVGAFEFQVRAPYMNATRPVWDEQGLLCYKRSGTSGLRVVVMGSSRIWSGLYSASVLSPKALLRAATVATAAAPFRLVAAVVRFICRTVCIGLLRSLADARWLTVAAVAAVLAAIAATALRTLQTRSR